MNKFRLEARTKDLRLAQSSILLQTAGTFIIGFAANIELTIMGNYNLIFKKNKRAISDTVAL